MTRNPGKNSGGPPAAHRTTQQLLQELVCLKADLDREREEKNHFQLERDHMLAWKGTVEKNLQDAEAKLRTICKEKQEAEERHRVEISVYKQKLKQILSHQQNSTTSPRNPVQNQNLQSRGVEKRVQEALTLKQQVELMEKSNDYNRRLRDMEVKFDLKMKALLEEQDRRRAAALRQQKEQAWSCMASLMEEHSRALRGEEERRSAAQEELQEAQQLIKELSATQEKNQEAQQELQRRLQEEVADLRSLLKEAQEELSDLREENRLLLQGFCKVTARSPPAPGDGELTVQTFLQVQQERDELLRRQEQSMADLQRRSTLKKELLDRKLVALSRFLERKEAQLLVAPPPPADDLPVSGAADEPNADGTTPSSGEELEAPPCSERLMVEEA